MTPEELEPEVAPTAPLEEPAPEAAPLNPIPWEDAGLTRLRGLGRTLKESLFYPGAFFQNFPREGWQEALSYALIVGTAGFLACLYWQLLFYLGLSRLLGSMPAGTKVFFLMGSGAFMSMMLLSPVIVLGSLIFSSLGLWLAVGLTGGPWPGFTVVWRLTCYAQGAMVLGVLPLLGGPVAGLWNLFLLYRGVQGGLGLSSWRALGVLCLSLVLQTLLLLLLLGSLWGLRLFSG
ncbi:MAG: YIP1 family protein [Syntrophales bacterium]|nr:YIP1 family protein [Syntrophales bacterium]